MGLITERYADKIAGVLSCYDRVIVQGTLPIFCYADGMTQYLSARGIRIFDFAEFAKPLTAAIKANADALAEAAGLSIDYVRKKNFRKEDRIKSVLAERGEHPGLVWIFSALEPCTTYQPWFNKSTKRSYLRPDDGKCLHYYFYFIDEELGLCYVRVPTWCPFRLQFYCNGHNWLARQLARKQIRFQMLDNAFTEIGDWEQAQRIADGWKPERLHRKLEEFARRYCPILKQIDEAYHWSLDTVEYATDIAFQRQADLQAIYGNLIRTAVHTVKPDDIATFLGKKLAGNYQDELGNRYNVRLEGTRVRHSMGKASIKMYDKFGRILRIETTTLDVTFFRHYRQVEQRDGTTAMKYAPMKKTIYSLGALRELLTAANRRYLEFISAIDDPSAGARKLRHLSQTTHEANRSYRGFNFFDDDDQRLFEAVARGEFHISGFQNKRLRALLPHLNSGQISRLLKRMRTHGLIKKAGRCYKYYLTSLGRQAIALGLELKNLLLIPELAHATTP
ncbi:MAG TPA: MarR family transcriptional regulator [Anaerolineae bacterium]|nr:MarR family transcriptional regulator [Anaerolineae bacterium]